MGEPHGMSNTLEDKMATLCYRFLPSRRLISLLDIIRKPSTTGATRRGLVDVQFYKRKMLRGQTSRSGEISIPKSPSFQLPRKTISRQPDPPKLPRPGRLMSIAHSSLFVHHSPALIDPYNSCSDTRETFSGEKKPRHGSRQA